MTCVGRRTHECNSGSNVIWATKHFLLEIKVHFRGENERPVLVIYSIIRELEHPEDIVTTIILLIGHNSNYHLNLCLYTYLYMRTPLRAHQRSFY